MPSAQDIKRTMPGWLNNKDVADFASALTLTIVFAGSKPVGQANEEKNVLLFAECPKGLVLNNKCVDALEALYGDSPLEGKKIRVTLIEDRGKEIKTILAPE